MKQKIWWGLALISITLMACQAVTVASTPAVLPHITSTANKSNRGGSTDFIFSLPADPLSASLIPDSGRSVEKMIPVEGGELQVEGADGTLYLLQIPGDALENETRIRMTPTAVSGLPFGAGPVLSVQMEPDGLAFLNYVTLTITPKVEIPVDQQIFFGYQAGGKDVILVPPVVNSREIKLLLLHFSGAGVTKGMLADLEPVRERLGGSAERRIQSEVAAKLAAERVRQLLGAGEEESTPLAELLADVFERYEKEVVAVRVAAAGESCAAGRLAIQTVLGVERQKQLLGAGEDDSGLSKYADLFDTVTDVCMQEEYELCAEDHIIHRIIPVWLGVERQRQLLGLGDQPFDPKYQALVQKCLTFDLEFHSEADFDDGGGGGYTSTVNAKIPVKFDPAELSIHGTTVLVNEQFAFRTPGCTVDSRRGGSAVAVMSLVPVMDKKSAEDELGYVRDFRLVFFPERTTEVFAVTCPDSPTYTSPPSGLWWSIFLVLHIDEVQQGVPDEPGGIEAPDVPAVPEMPDIEGMLAGAMGGFSMPMMPVPAVMPGGGFLVEDWEVFGDEYFAKKEWIKDDPSIGISEVGTLKLYHRPGK